MLSENVYVNKEGLNIPVTKESWSFLWECPSCHRKYLITKDNIEYFTDSDPHDPLQDYMICKGCEHSEGLFNGVEGFSQGMYAKIWADGSYLYLHRLGKDERIV